MNTYIALLRGINVGGHKKIKMAELKEHLKTLNFEQVSTYIQSGNIVFNSPNDSIHDLEEQIHEMILEQYGFDVPVIIKTAKELKHVIDHHPYIDHPSYDIDRTYITYLNKAPDPSLIKQLAATDFSPEEYVIDQANIHFYSPKGYGKAKMNNNLFENKLKVKATTRNWKTTLKLLEMAAENEVNS